MLYAERTLQVRAALLQRPDLIATIRSIFEDHIAQNGREPIGKGNNRTVYAVGECSVGAEKNLVLLLKLNQLTYMRYSAAARRLLGTEMSEFGAFETYYDFVAGHISHLSFRSGKAYGRYCEKTSPLRPIPRKFSLGEPWGGTTVSVGDLGALPYFQMAIRYGRKWFGCLTEGTPPLLEPKHTAEYSGTYDEQTVEDGRIIDLGRSQCELIAADRGGGLGYLSGRYPGNLKIRARGEKYFTPQYRLDIE